MSRTIPDVVPHKQLRTFVIFLSYWDEVIHFFHEAQWQCERIVDMPLFKTALLSETTTE